MILRFVHGWGFAASLWDGVIALLPDHDCRADDRGYFGPAATPAIDDEHIAIGHSLGTLHLLAAPLPGCRGLFAINGFDRFAAAPGFPGIAPRVLDRMVQRLEADPDTVVGEFRARCEAPAARRSPAVTALRADLQMLRDMDCRGGPWPAPLVTLEADDDPLLPLPMRDAVFAFAAGRVRLRQRAGGHLLPLTAPAACAAAIRDVLDSL